MNFSFESLIWRILIVSISHADHRQVFNPFNFIEEHITEPMDFFLYGLLTPYNYLMDPI